MTHRYSGALITLSPAAIDRLLQTDESALALSGGIRRKIYASLPVTLYAPCRHPARALWRWPHPPCCPAAIAPCCASGYAPGGGAQPVLWRRV